MGFAEVATVCQELDDHAVFARLARVWSTRSPTQGIPPMEPGQSAGG
ncbi:hypothetical protein CLJ1_3224 [Pseudomonas paraeruginosa]|nr:hypothetical protein CLJ1_3224 [Pseudomonas aeruginosa]